jgi:hypothetical protein
MTHAYTPSLSLSLIVPLNYDKNSFPSYDIWLVPYRLPQSIVLSRPLEIFKAAVSSIKYESMKHINSFKPFQLSCETSDIIFNLLKVARTRYKYLGDQLIRKHNHFNPCLCIFSSNYRIAKLVLKSTNTHWIKICHHNI